VTLQIYTHLVDIATKCLNILCLMSKIDSTTLILNAIKKHYNFKTNTEFAAFLDIKPQTLSSWYTRGTIDYDLLYSKCVDVDANWLLSGGQGEMLKAQIVSTGDNSINNTGGNHGNQIIGGNSINVSLPASGSQKIINPDGSVEIRNNEPDVNQKTLNLYETVISNQNKTILAQEKTIATHEETIESLKKQIAQLGGKN